MNLMKYILQNQIQTHMIFMIMVLNFLTIYFKQTNIKIQYVTMILSDSNSEETNISDNIEILNELIEEEIH